MRLLMLPLLAAALPACSMGVSAERSAEVAFELGDAEHLHVSSRNGSLSVRASDGTKLSGSTKFKASAPTQEGADARVAQMDWEARREGDTLVITLMGPNDDKRDYGASLDLLVPTGVTLELESGNGGITVEGEFPRVVLATSNGDVQVRTDARVRARSSNGKIHYAGASEDFELRTSNGQVEAMLAGDWSGRGVIDTSNGSVDVECSGTLGAVVTASTRNGKIRTTGATEDGPGTLKIETSNGSVTVRGAGGPATAEPEVPVGTGAEAGTR